MLSPHPKRAYSKYPLKPVHAANNNETLIPRHVKQKQKVVFK